MQNRHPADRLADVRSEIKRLEAEEEYLRAYLLEHPEDHTGEDHIAVVGSQSRKRVDLRALADEIGASVLERFTSFRSTMLYAYNSGHRSEAALEASFRPPVPRARGMVFQLGLTNPFSQTMVVQGVTAKFLST